MRCSEIIKLIVEKNGLTLPEASRKIGYSRTYLQVTASRDSAPQCDTMAHICDELGWELLVRDRSDGFEISIDPPIK